MHRALSLIPVCLLAATTANTAQAGPFGVDMGMPLDGLGKPESELSTGYYHFVSLPKSHPAFEGYVVQATPRQGVCWIKAVGLDIPTNEDGTELKAGFEDMRGKLQRIYGQHDRVDVLDPDSIWNEPEDFMAGILFDDRVYLADWSESYGSTLPDNLIKVGLLAEATENTIGYYTVEYYFENHELCDREIEEIEAANFDPVDEVL